MLFEDPIKNCGIPDLKIMGGNNEIIHIIEIKAKNHFGKKRKSAKNRISRLFF